MFSVVVMIMIIVILIIYVGSCVLTDLFYMSSKTCRGWLEFKIQNYPVTSTLNVNGKTMFLNYFVWLMYI